MVTPRARARRWLFTTCLIGALLPGPLALVHADDGVDTACAVASVEHDAAAHRFTTGGGSPHAAPEHCYVCHGLCSIRPIAVRPASLAPDVREHTPTIGYASPQHSRPRASRIPARAPPA